MADRRLVGTTEAARAVGVHYGTLSRWAKERIVQPAERTAGGSVRPGHLRWDVDDLRRQLAVNDERAAVDPLRAAYAHADVFVAGIGDLHAALVILGKLVAALQEMLDDATVKRSKAAERIYEADALALKPLADRTSTSSARRRGR